MTSGGRPDWVVLAGVALCGLLVTVVNATSLLIEYEGAGLRINSWEPWVWEASSVPVVVALAPLIGWLVRIAPPVPGRLLRAAAIHLAGATAFSLLHVAGMVALRKAIYGAVGWTYDFGGGRLWIELVYEWRKDLLAYGVIAAGFWLWRNWRTGPAADPAAAAPAGRLEIRDGARTLFLDIGAISTVQAAGNYVEIHADGRTYLARGTLASFEQRLAAAGFLRVHRSRLVNPAHIRSWKPTASGDAEIALADGRSVSGSRRYRDVLGNLPAA